MSSAKCYSLHILCWNCSVTPEMLLCGRQHHPWMLHLKSKLLPEITKGSFPFNAQTVKQIREGVSTSPILANLAIETGKSGRKAVAKSQDW